MNSYLVLYRTEDDRHGAMSINANDEEAVGVVVNRELTGVLGPGAKFWYQFVDTSKTKGHIFDIRREDSTVTD